MSRPFQYRDANGDLLLDEALGERYVRHYVKMLESGEQRFAEMQLAAAIGAPPGDETDAHADTWRPRGPVIDGYVLSQEGSGPEQCSSSQALGQLPEICWDVCGYYRRLGFRPSEFRQVTAKALRLRYLALDPRQENGHLFYAMSQLLDPLIRRAYDLMPLGGLFLGDRDVRELIERKAALEASRRNAADPWTDSDQAQVLKDWGFEKGVSAEEARERLRADPEQAAPLGGEAGALGRTLSGWDRKWAWFALADPEDGLVPPPDGRVLEAWQEMLCTAFSARGLTVRFSVGIWPGETPKMWRDSNNCCIFFIGNEPPAQHLANEAVRGYALKSVMDVMGRNGQRGM